ncbi:MAG: hypothetical protein ACI4EV_06735 [Lachnospiraceae bacterium]
MKEKEKKFRNLPAFLTLLAGFITSVIGIICGFTLVRTLWTLVVIMVIFFTLGLGIRFILNKTLVIPNPEENQEGEESKEGEEENSETKEPKEPKAK